MSIQASLSAVSLGQHPRWRLPGELCGDAADGGDAASGGVGVAARESVARGSHSASPRRWRSPSLALLRSRASARLEASREGERLRTALIDSVTHELRTPLTSIRAAATTLRQGEGLDDAAQQELVAIVDEESARLDALIGEAVEMAEIDANVLQVAPAPQHTRTLLEHAVREVTGCAGVAPGGDSGGGARRPGLVRSCSCWAACFAILLENAARYCPPGSRIVLRSRRSGDRLEFSVEDNGPGIDPVDLPLIFEKFYRGKKSTGKGKGTGMGLAIARAIVAAHGGGIEANELTATGNEVSFLGAVGERKQPELKPRET